ncbi:MAG: hypothetical protein M1818_000298 [Claussenomyces sp. TS43310]|nr:MAG: hypothetical protein M1818_000298 [Claussenomyces sp. TS43310]
MRRTNVLLGVVTLSFVFLMVYECSTLISLLFEPGTRYAIRKADMPAPGSELIDARPQLIPKIIHQTYINSTIPEQWRAGQQACVNLHSDYEYKLWTDAASRNFIAAEYPWFLTTFDSYPFPIQRADAIRYFVLAYFGGIYIDLDDGCNRRLDPLLSYPAWVRKTTPTGVSNDAMGSIPQHPFFLKVIESLETYHRSWAMPYITVMYSTGPLFLSVLWKEYTSLAVPPMEQVRLLMPDEYSKHAWSFFKIAKGSSWHGEDAQTIFWMGKHWMFLTFMGFALAGVLGTALWWTCAKCEKIKRGKPVTTRRLLPWSWISRGSEKGNYEHVMRMA